MPGLRRAGGLRRLVLVLPCDEEVEAGLDPSRLASEMDDPGSRVHARADPRLCTSERGTALGELVEGTGAQALVVGGPSPRTHGRAWREEARRLGIPPHRVEVVPLREQCVWIAEDAEAARRRARIMLEAAISRVDLGKEAEPRRVEAMRSVLVVGGGVAGMQAAADLADLGRKVYLVERTESLGGRAHQLSRTYPTQDCKPDGCCPQSCRDCVFTPPIDLVESHPLIEVMTSSEVVDVRGGYGGYQVTVSGTDTSSLLDVGAVVVATGNRVFDPSEMTELSPDHPDVVTFLELEELIDWQRKDDHAWTPLRRPSDGRQPQRIHFLQCVGSRDAHHGTIDCSLVCCTYAIGQATDLKRMFPDSMVSVHYMDLRGPYRGFERHYLEAQEEGVLFHRGRVVEIQPAGDHLVLDYEDVELGQPVSVEADLVVLSVGQLPAEGTEELAEMLGMPVDEDGYMVEDNSAYSLWDRRGVYVVGCAAGPRGIRYSVRDGREAALSIEAVLRRREVELSDSVAEVVEDRCTGCGQCVEVCEYGAVVLEERTDVKTGRRYYLAVVDPRRCWSCGNCAATCPSSAIRLEGYSDEQLVGEIEVASGGR